jgi:hypothetical protein
MKIYNTFDQFWPDYFNGKLPEAGFDAWAIAKFTHTNDQEYQRLNAEGKDTLGYQPTMLTLADPLKQKKAEVIIKGLPTAAYDSLRQQYQHRFVDQLPKRFGLFHSDKKQADAIFDTWQAFIDEWLTRDGESLLPYNLPLLFDHVPDAEYWGWKQKGFDPCGTQRLIVTLFQYRTGRFADVFITNVADAEMSRIKMLMQSKLTLQAEDLF